MVGSDVFREFGIINDDVGLRDGQISQRNGRGILLEEALGSVNDEGASACLFPQEIETVLVALVGRVV